MLWVLWVIIALIFVAIVAIIVSEVLYWRADNEETFRSVIILRSAGIALIIIAMIVLVLT